MVLVVMLCTELTHKGSVCLKTLGAPSKWWALPWMFLSIFWYDCHSSSTGRLALMGPELQLTLHKDL
jgi:hypothetical protein